MKIHQILNLSDNVSTSELDSAFERERDYLDTVAPICGWERTLLETKKRELRQAYLEARNAIDMGYSPPKPASSRRQVVVNSFTLPSLFWVIFQLLDKCGSKSDSFFSCSLCFFCDGVKEGYWSCTIAKIADTVLSVILIVSALFFGIRCFFSSLNGLKRSRRLRQQRKRYRSYLRRAEEAFRLFQRLNERNLNILPFLRFVEILPPSDIRFSAMVLNIEEPSGVLAPLMQEFRAFRALRARLTENEGFYKELLDEDDGRFAPMFTFSVNWEV